MYITCISLIWVKCDLKSKKFISHTSVQAQVKVIAIFCDEDKVRRAGPGENLRVRLSGIEEEEILSGFVLSSSGMFLLSFFICLR